MVALPAHPRPPTSCRPGITFGDGRVVVTATGAAFGRTAEGYLNLYDYRTTLQRLTLSVSADVRVTDRIGVVAMITDEVALRGRDPDPSDRHIVYPYALYLRVKPTPDRPFAILAGRIPPVFGAFARRDYGEVNALIGLPLAYGYSTTMRPEPPPSRRELLLNRGGGWAVRYPRATATAGPQGVPLVSARRWDTGVSAQWDGRTVQAGVSVTMGTLSSPRTDDDNDGADLRPRRRTPKADVTIGVRGTAASTGGAAGPPDTERRMGPERPFHDPP